MDERHAWVRLSRLDMSPRKVNSLLDEFGSAEAVFRAPLTALSGLPGITSANVDKIRELARLSVDEDVRRLDAVGARVVAITSPEYPERLRQIQDPPPVLYVCGEIQGRDDSAVAIVGTRRASQYGRTVTERLAHDLASHGITIISGFARGIDITAHTAALQAGGRSLAVFGTGIDDVYPPEHRQHVEKTIAAGALVSEYPPGTPPEPWRFPSRNRIISGLSLGIIVTEAPLHSGALITADYAADQGRDVMAVPGSILSDRSAGPHQLIRDGAALVESADDVFQVLGIQLVPPSEQPSLPLVDLSATEQKVYSLLSLKERHIDSLAVESGLAPADTNAALMLLEIKGLVRRLPGGYFMRCPTAQV